MHMCKQLAKLKKSPDLKSLNGLYQGIGIGIVQGSGSLIARGKGIGCLWKLLIIIACSLGGESEWTICWLNCPQTQIITTYVMLEITSKCVEKAHFVLRKIWARPSSRPGLLLIAYQETVKNCHHKFNSTWNRKGQSSKGSWVFSLGPGPLLEGTQKGWCLRLYSEANT